MADVNSKPELSGRRDFVKAAAAGVTAAASIPAPDSTLKSIYAPEYEAGSWDGVEGSRCFPKEVLAAL